MATAAQTVVPALASFNPAVNSADGTTPVAVAVGDLNGDPNPDAALADYDSNSVSILFGAGDGTLSAGPTYPVGKGPSAILAADFNHNGKLDLAVVNSGAKSVSILIGNGTGTFVIASLLHTDSGPSAVAAGDFNGDGQVDLAVTNRISDSVSIFLGTGSGTFIAGSTFSVGNGPVAIAAGDFNGDGKTDLAVVDQGSNWTVIFLGTGAGTFIPASMFATGLKPTGIAVGDLNHDGKQDLVISNQSANTVSVLLGNGSGGFAPRPSQPTNAGPRAVVLADFNHDGKLDVATANGNANNVSVLIGDGAGGFIPWAQSPFATGSTPSALAVGDVNQDSALDIVTANAGSNNASVLLSQAVTATSIVSSSNPSTSGENIMFTANVTHPGGSLVPGGNVTFKDGGVAIGTVALGATGSAHLSTAALAPGTHVMTAAYSGDANYDPSESASLAQTVNEIPSTGALVADPSPADVTQTVTLSAHPTGGSLTYSYAWSLTSVPAGSTATLLGPTAASPTFPADQAGSYGVRLVVTDSHGIASPASNLTIVANAHPGVPVISLNPSPADVGQQVTATAALSGGTGPYSYVWSIVAAPTGSTATLDSAAASPTFTPNVPGAYTLHLSVTDHNHVQAGVASITLAVNPAPSAGPITSTPDPADTGQTITVSASTSGGTGAFAYAWTLTGKPAGSNAALSSSAISPTFVPDKGGVYTVALTVTDGNGVEVIVNPLAITVIAAPSINSISANPNPADAGQTVHFSASIGGGTVPYSYSWTLTSPSGLVTHLAGATPSLVVNEVGAYSVAMVVTDGNGVSSSPMSITLTVHTDPNAGIITATPTPSDLTQPVTVSGNPSGGTGTYTFTWTLSVPTGSSAALSSTTVTSPTFTPDILGTYHLTLVVTDSNLISSPASNLNLIPLARPSAGSPAASPSSPDVSQPTSLSTVPSGGTGGYTYAWSFTTRPAGSVATLVGASATSPTFTPDKTGTYVVSVTVTDSNAVSSAPATVSVVAVASPEVTSITFSPPTGEVGSAINASATTSGGAGALAYAWTLTSAPIGSKATLSNAGTANPAVTPDFAGSYTVQLVVTDSNSISSPGFSASVTVNAALSIGPITTTPSSPAAGTLTTASVTPSGGVGPNVYSWTLAAPAGSAAGLSDSTSQRRRSRPTSRVPTRSASM